MAVNSNTVSAKAKKVPPNRELTVMVDGKILNRFESFSINHALDVCPMSFELVYGMDDGENDNSLSLSNLKSTATSLTKSVLGGSKSSSSSTVSSSQVAKGLLKVGQKIEIYLEQQHTFTGYIDSVSEAYSYGQHKLYISGRSLVSVIVDSTTNQPSGMLPTSITTLKDVADYMFSGFGIITKDNTYGETKYPMANLLQIDLTTKPFDYVSTLAQYEGKLLYDNSLGQMVIDNVAKDTTDHQYDNNDQGYKYLGKDADGIATFDSSGTMKAFDCITDDNSAFESIAVHKTTLGRYRNYTCVINAFGGPAGIPNIFVPNITAQDHDANELPPGKNITVVSQAAYPSSATVMNGLLAYQTDLMQYTANTNWGRGQTVSGTATGFLNPITKRLWRVNTFVKFDMDKPKINGGLVVQSVNFYIDEYGGRKTDLVFVPPEALQVAPITITPLLYVNGSSNNDQDSSNDASTTVQKPTDVAAPTNAKPNSSTSATASTTSNNTNSTT